MTSARPYLLRAMYEWLVDNNLTPHLLVDATDSRARVPQQFVEDGQIVLNVAPGAVRDLDLGNDFVSFSARFSGVAHSIVLPVSAVRAVYARENGQGMALGEDTDAPDSTTPVASVEETPVDTAGSDDNSSPRSGRPPHLTLVE